MRGKDLTRQQRSTRRLARCDPDPLFLPHTIPISHLSPYTQFSPSLDLYLSSLRVYWEVGKLRRELRQKEDELKEHRVKDLHHEWVVTDLKQEHHYTFRDVFPSMG